MALKIFKDTKPLSKAGIEPSSVEGIKTPTQPACKLTKIPSADRMAKDFTLGVKSE
jgi:hypothetical protein